MREHLISSITTLVLATEQSYRSNADRTRALAVTAGYRFQPSKEIFDQCVSMLVRDPVGDPETLVKYFFENYDLFSEELFSEVWQTTPLETLLLIGIYVERHAIKKQNGMPIHRINPNDFKLEFYTTGTPVNKFFGGIIDWLRFTQQLLWDDPGLDQSLILGDQVVEEFFSREWGVCLTRQHSHLPKDFLERWNRKRVIFGLGG